MCAAIVPSNVPDVLYGRCHSTLGHFFLMRGRLLLEVRTIPPGGGKPREQQKALTSQTQVKSILLRSFPRKKAPEESH